MIPDGSGRWLRPAYLRAPLLFAPSAALPLYSAVPLMLTRQFFSYVPTPVQIPLTWFSQPFALRMQSYVRRAQVTSTGGVTGYAQWPGGKGTNTFTASLDTSCDADPRTLANFQVDYHQTPRMTLPRARIDLIYRSTEERHRILKIKIDDRVQITGVAAEFPDGADMLVVTGRRESISRSRWIVEWTFDPVLGQGGNAGSSVAAGVPGPWVAANRTILAPDGSTTDKLAF